MVQQTVTDTIHKEKLATSTYMENVVEGRHEVGNDEQESRHFGNQGSRV